MSTPTTRAQLWLPHIDRSRMFGIGAMFLDAPRRRRRVRVSLQLLLSAAGCCKRRRPDLPVGWGGCCDEVLPARDDREVCRWGRPRRGRKVCTRDHVRRCTV